MGPSHLANDHHIRPKINGPRPSALKISKDSHLIHKSSSSSTPPSLPIPPNKQQRQPIIIYTHSPKIIRTEPRNFMALVQKLTGMRQSDVSEIAKDGVPRLGDDRKHGAGIPGCDDSARAPSFQFVEEDGGVGVADIQPNPLFYDAPLFTPAAHYRCPSVMEFLKPFQEY